MTASRRRSGRNVGVRRCQRSRQAIDLAETPASERVAHGYPESMARKIRPGFGEIELQRIAASVAPDDPALAPAGFDNPGVRITPSEIERHFFPHRCRNARRQHPGEIDPLSPRNDGRRLRIIDFSHPFRDVQGASHLSAIHPRRVRSSSPAASWTQSLRRRHSLDLKPHHCPATFVVASAFLWSA